MLGYSVIILTLLVAGISAYVRLAPTDASAQLVDPSSVTPPTSRKYWLVAEGGDAPPVVLTLSPDQAAAKLATIATATPRTALLAGSGLHTTWITRSALMGYPDYTTVLIAPAPGGSQITIYARSRFGEGDFGVNRARVEIWLSQLRT